MSEGAVRRDGGGEGVAELVLDRPAKLNAVTPAMARALRDHLRDLDEDPAVRCVLLRGEGERAFCAGTDLASLAAYESVWAFRNRVEYAAALRGLRKPAVAALRGWVLGGGAELALAADLRVAAEDARLGFPEVTRGWVGGGGASQLLPRLVGQGRAARLLMLGEPVGAEEARAMGLVEEVVPVPELLPRARALAARLASLSPVAVQSVKAALRAAAEAPLSAGLVHENELNALCFAGGDHLAGIRAFEDRRPGGAP